MSEENKDLIEAESTTPTEDSPKKEKKKKKVIVVGQDSFGLHYLGFEGGGELPNSLKNSKFTSSKDAQEAADSFNRGR
jgi:hypothetical protein